MLQIDPKNGRGYVFYNNYANGAIEMVQSKMNFCQPVSVSPFSKPIRVLETPEDTLVYASGTKGIVNPEMGIMVVASGRTKAIIETRLLLNNSTSLTTGQKIK